MLESNRPGVMTKLGLDYETVKKINPGIITALFPASVKQARTVKDRDLTRLYRDTAASWDLRVKKEAVRLK